MNKNYAFTNIEIYIFRRNVCKRCYQNYFSCFKIKWIFFYTRTHRHYIFIICTYIKLYEIHIYYVYICKAILCWCNIPTASIFKDIIHTHTHTTNMHIMSIWRTYVYREIGYVFYKRHVLEYIVEYIFRPIRRIMKMYLDFNIRFYLRLPPYIFRIHVYAFISVKLT